MKPSVTSSSVIPGSSKNALDCFYGTLRVRKTGHTRIRAIAKQKGMHMWAVIDLLLDHWDKTEGDKLLNLGN